MNEIPHPKAQADDAEPFWTFSVQIYDQGPVRDLCIQLQDEMDADVNILLFCLWLASRNRRSLSLPDIRELNDKATPWHNRVVQPLRSARRALRDLQDHGENGPFKRRLQDIELEAERIEQGILESLATKFPIRPEPAETEADAALTSLQSYMEFLGKTPTDASLRRSLRDLVAAAFR